MEIDKEAPPGYKYLREGQAKILYHVKELCGAKWVRDSEKKETVFYNPVQEFNRDISILAITQFGLDMKSHMEEKKKEFVGIKILEALAATGLRSVRYAKEIGEYA